MNEYRNLKMNLGETIQDFSTIFNSVYDSITTDIKPLPRLAMLRYPYGFDVEFSYHLRRRNLATLEDMQKKLY